VPLHFPKISRSHVEPDLPLSLESFTGSLQKLISKFEADKDYYLSKAYSEAQARVDFITPFFKALGWDMENEAGLAHHARGHVRSREPAE
jgi:hypothetical protein